jgi:hypothetical protein
MQGTWKTTSGGSGGGLVLAVIVVAGVLIGSGAASAAVSAVVTILVIAGVLVGLVLVGGVGVLIYRARQVPESLSAPRIPAPAAYQVAAEVRPQLGGARVPAIEPPREIHYHLHGLTPDQLAAVMRHQTEED